MKQREEEKHSTGGGKERGDLHGVALAVMIVPNFRVIEIRNPSLG
jgi:hypothetical protein